MEVVLRENIENLGLIGDVVEVADGYARNYLLPKKLAIRVSEANLVAIERGREARRQREMEELERVKELAQKLEGFLCYIEALATEAGHLFGSVGAGRIAANLREQGFEVADDVVQLATNIKEVGTSEVTLEFAEDLTAKVNVIVVAQQDKESGPADEDE